MLARMHDECQVGERGMDCPLSNDHVVVLSVVPPPQTLLVLFFDDDDLIAEGASHLQNNDYVLLWLP